MRMGQRNKPPRLTHPLMVAAAALSRATDPSNPSRLTVLRLLGDALHALQESHMRIMAIKARHASHTNKTLPHPLTRQHVEADNRFRQAHDEGARALFAVSVTTLIKLPSRGGALRRRAIDLLKTAALATGPASAMAAADRLRSHINSLKRMSWTATDPADFDVSAAIFTLAEVSSCQISSRDVARESVLFLLSQRVRQKCRRGDLAHAVAIILASFPQHAPPDDRLVDIVLEFSVTTPSIQQGLSAFSGALLVSIVAPFVVSRGPSAGDDIAKACVRAMNVAPTPTERGMWAVALGRAIVTARRSTTYQLRKYGTSEMGSKFPRGHAAMQSETPSLSDPTVWVSNEVFEESLVQMANMTRLCDAEGEASTSLASVMRMWSLALTSNYATIIPRVFNRLRQHMVTPSVVSVTVDAIWLGLLKYLKPSQSAAVLDELVSLQSETGLGLAAVLSTTALLIGKHGRQSLKESGLSTEYNTTSSVLIKRVHDCLASTSFCIRQAAVRLMVALVEALPRTCTHFLTAVLQNLRIADLSLATRPVTQNVGSTKPDSEIAALLGNSAALSVLLEKVGRSPFSVPTPLTTQCIVDIIALLRPHPASPETSTLPPLTTCARRRVAWAGIALLARSKKPEAFEEQHLETLLQAWKDELKYSGSRGSKALANGSSSIVSFSESAATDNTDMQVSSALEEATARSVTRTTALAALEVTLRNFPSEKLEQSACSFSTACSSRILSILSSINSNLSSGNSPGLGTFVGFEPDLAVANDQGLGSREAAVELVKAVTSESCQLATVIRAVPSSGDPGEVSFYVSMALAEEAQRALGEMDAAHSFCPVNNTTSSSHKAVSFDSALSNDYESLLVLKSPVVTYAKTDGEPVWKREKRNAPDASDDSLSCPDDLGWAFGERGISCPSAERTLISAGQAIASTIAADIAAHGSLIESLPVAKLSPALCAIISLEITKRLSRSDLAEINRALAVLQILVRRSLGLTGGSQRSISSQNKNGRLYTPTTSGDGRNLCPDDLPGAGLQGTSSTGSWLSWARTFSDEAHLSKVPFHNYHTRALGVMYATRSLASEAYRELSITGGSALWIGLMNKVTGIVRDNIGGSSPSQYVTVSNAIATLGALLEAVPESPGGSGRRSPGSSPRRPPEQTKIVDEIAVEAVNVIAEAIESGKSHIQATAALALSSRSSLVASCSERLCGALLRAWAQDRGDFESLGHFGRCADESDMWVSCFDKIWSDMGIRDVNGRARFFQQDSRGVGTVSAAFATGAAAVLGACRHFSWPLTEACFLTVKEISTDLIQWNGTCSQQARAAGLYGMAAIWGAKIDSAQSERLCDIMANPSADGVDKPTALLDPSKFSLLDSARVSSPVGPFLDEVLYDALAPREVQGSSLELRSAAIAAIAEIIRGMGAAHACTHLTRLPEMLFSAVEGRTPCAQWALDSLVRKDGRQRPRYWFGLCRAVALSGERLNYGRKDVVWDVSYRTRAYAAQVAVAAVDSSLSSCSCYSAESNPHTGSMKHGCAYGFLRKVYDFVKFVSSAAGFDYECCGHGCRLLQKVASRVGLSAGTMSLDDETIPEFFDLWDPSVAMMHTLLADRVPHVVVNSAASAISELLVAYFRIHCRIRRIRHFLPASLSSEPASSFIMAMLESDVRQRFLFADQGEEVGVQVSLAVVSRLGRIFSALKASCVDNASGAQVTGEHVAKALLYAVAGDFLSTTDGQAEGMQELDRTGGALNPPRIGVAYLHEAFRPHVVSTILGAVSTVGLTVSTESDSSAPSHSKTEWINKESPGARMADAAYAFDRVALASFVWLVQRERTKESSKSRRAPFYDQAQDAMQHLVSYHPETSLEVLHEDVFVTFANRSSTEYLKFVERFSKREHIRAECFDLIFDLTLSTFLVALQDDFGNFQENESKSIARGLRALNQILSHREMETTKCTLLAKKVLDTVLQMTDGESSVSTSVLVSRNVLPLLKLLVTHCLRMLKTEENIAETFMQKVWDLFEEGKRLQSPAHSELSSALALCIRGSAATEHADPTFSMIELAMSIESRGRTGFSLAPLLSSAEFEENIMDYIKSTAENDGKKLEELLLVLGELITNEVQFSIPVAMRCSIAAIVVDGANCSGVNKMAMVLYSRLLSKLVHNLPSAEDIESGELQPDARECANYFLELVEDDVGDPGSFVGSVQLDDRRNALRFLEAWCASSFAT